ncbi:MAG: hypothetical protein GY744_12190 [Gammaproteobacteria bacterium]|nr:hypothetical protein [Gammaproteobacteria bacterium]
MFFNHNFLAIFITIALTLSVSGISHAIEEQKLVQSEGTVLFYSGFFSREENDGKMAQLSGKSHYMKFYPPNRIIRLFIPYPYSTKVKPEAIASVFNIVSKKSMGDAFIRGKFDVMDQSVIANLGTVKTGEDIVLFDCDSSSPCRIEFTEKDLKVIKKGILADHIIVYDHVNVNAH